MKLVINIGALSKRFDDFETLSMLKKAGFDGYDYTFPSVADCLSADIDIVTSTR